MRSTSLHAFVLATAVGVIGTSSVPSAADPKPLPVKPSPPPDGKGAKKQVQFPMQSADFRPFFEKLMAEIDSKAAAARSMGEDVPEGYGDKMRFRASQAMEDGVVTAVEFDYIMAVLE